MTTDVNKCHAGGAGSDVVPPRSISHPINQRRVANVPKYSCALQNMIRMNQVENAKMGGREENSLMRQDYNNNALMRQDYNNNALMRQDYNNARDDRRDESRDDRRDESRDDRRDESRDDDSKCTQIKMMPEKVVALVEKRYMILSCLAFVETKM
jgi:hypothetical protein